MEMGVGLVNLESAQKRQNAGANEKFAFAPAFWWFFGACFFVPSGFLRKCQKMPRFFNQKCAEMRRRRIDKNGSEIKGIWKMR